MTPARVGADNWHTRLRLATSRSPGVEYSAVAPLCARRARDLQLYPTAALYTRCCQIENYPITIIETRAGGTRTHDPGIMRSRSLTLVHTRQTAGTPGGPSVLYSPNPRL
jgi:hypothetical protein